MGSFAISDTLRNTLTGAVYEVYNNTLGVLSPITIHKEPIKTVISSPNSPLYGYGDDAQSTNEEITYTAVNSIFSGQIITPNSPKSRGNQAYFDSKLALDPNSAYLRTANKNVYNYLFDGRKTEKIEAEGVTYNFKNKFQVQNFLSLEFYFFELEATT